MNILTLIGIVFMIIGEMLHGNISLNSVLLMLLVNFVSGLLLELMYISLIKNIRSSLTHLHSFQLLVQLPSYIEITFLFAPTKSSEFKVKVRQASKHCKMVLAAAKLAYANKKKNPSLPRKLALRTFGGSALLPLFNSPEVSSASDEVQLFAAVC